MFLEQYKNFKKVFENSNEVYERFSIGRNLLFQLNDYYTLEYLNGEKQLDTNFINDFDKELHNTLLKLEFIHSFLKDYLEKQQEESEILDAEYLNITNCLTTKGQAFLKMFKLQDHFNHIVSTKTIYLKNIKEYNNYAVKTSESLNELTYYIEDFQSKGFYLHFNEAVVINNIFLEFYNEYTISIFGVKEDGSMESLFDSVSSSHEVFINAKDTKYKSLYFLSGSNITRYIKDIKVFSYIKNESNDKFGYLIKKMSNIEKLSQLNVVNDSNTKFYIYTKDECKKLISLLSQNENSAIEKYINDNYKINLNEPIDTSNYKGNELYLLEFFDQNNHKSYVTQIYGKEK